MAAMIRLADYQYYSDVYKGSMAEDDFNRNILTVSAYLDKITFGRIEARIPDLGEDIKHLACLCADEAKILSDAGVDGRKVASVSNDGYSVSFADSGSADIQGDTESKIYRLARLYLPGELFYAGVC